MGNGERNAVSVFCLVVVAFVTGPVVVGIAVLYIFKDEHGERLMDFSKSINEIPWGAALLVMGMFVVVPCLTADNAGIAWSASPPLLWSWPSSSHAMKCSAIMIPIFVFLFLAVIHPIPAADLPF